MKNSIICKNCGTENPLYELICQNCKAFLRTKIPNIDFWATLLKILESPYEAIINIIYASHKNFLFITLTIGAFKVALNSLIISNAISHNYNRLYFSELFYLSIFTIVIIVFLSFIITIFNNLLKLKSRFKDNLSIYTYSLIPIIIALLVLTPVEYALFGNYWFTFNPSPFIIKNIPSYILICIELIFLLWSCLLFIISTYVQSKNIYYSIFAGVMFFIIVNFSPLLFFLF